MAFRINRTSRDMPKVCDLRTNGVEIICNRSKRGAAASLRQTIGHWTSAAMRVSAAVTDTWDKGISGCLRCCLTDWLSECPAGTRLNDARSTDRRRCHVRQGAGARPEREWHERRLGAQWPRWLRRDGPVGICGRTDRYRSSQDVRSGRAQGEKKSRHDHAGPYHHRAGWRVRHGGGPRSRRRRLHRQAV
jgi:hypothetical protein